MTDNTATQFNSFTNSQPSDTNQQVPMNNSVVVEEDDDDDDFGNFQGVSEPSVGGTNNQTDSTQPQSSTFASPEPQATEPSGWDALDALGVADAPLPTLPTPDPQMPSSAEPQLPTNEMENQLPTGPAVVEDSAEDEFGDFASTEFSPDDLEQAVLPQPASTESAAAPVGLDALDSAFGEIENAPLPQLGATQDLTGRDKNGSKGDSEPHHVDGLEDDDDFGDFVGLDGQQGSDGVDVIEASKDIVPPIPPRSLSKSFEGDLSLRQPDGMERSISAPPVSDTISGGFDAFDDLVGGTQDAPLPALESFAEPVASDFGGLGSTETHEKQTPFGESSDLPSSSMNVENTDHFAMGQDAMRNKTDAVNQPTPVDDFGDFHAGEGTSAQPDWNEPRVEAEDTGMGDPDDEDGFSGFVSNSKQVNSGEQGTAVEHGALSSSVQSQTAVTSVVGGGSPNADLDCFSNGADDPFAGLPEVEDAPLPPLTLGLNGKEIRGDPDATVQSLTGDGAQRSSDLSEAFQSDSQPTEKTISESAPCNTTSSSDRADSEFYSATGSTSGDLEGFESAAENEKDADESRLRDSKTKSESLYGQDISTASHPQAEADLFSAFDKIEEPTNKHQPDLLERKEVEQRPGSKAVSNDEEFSESEGFGDFASAEFMEGVGSGMLSPSDQLDANPAEPSGFDSFGDFASAEFSGDLKPAPATAEDAFSNNIPDRSTSEQDFFGGFSNTESKTAGMEKMVTENTNNQPGQEVIDEFGDFDSAEFSVGSGTAEKETSGGTDGFAAFDQAPPQNVLDEKNSAEDDPEVGRLRLVRDHIVASSQRLPDAIRRKSEGNSGYIDFGDCFDANIGLDIPCSDEKKRRIQTCLTLMEFLCDNSKLASTYWHQSICVAREELAIGLSLLQEASKCLSPGELVHCHSRLETYVHQLGELVRVTRSIEASIGDLLMLDSSSLLTVDTFASSWCSVQLLKVALEVEQLWKNIEKHCAAMKLSSKGSTANKLESLVEIRTHSASQDPVPVAGRRCHFTLQPILERGANEESTKSPVSWKGANYMACTANFLRHKCPFYVVG